VQIEDSAFTHDENPSTLVISTTIAAIMGE
jgi:hypothetical protein